MSLDSRRQRSAPPSQSKSLRTARWRTLLLAKGVRGPSVVVGPAHTTAQQPDGADKRPCLGGVEPLRGTTPYGLAGRLQLIRVLGERREDAVTASVTQPAWGGCLGGVLGGLINAWLCYAGWPVGVPDAQFEWHIVPSGAVHGGVLAGLTLLAVRLLPWQSRGGRSCGILLAGWVVGWVSWVPLNHSAFEASWVESLLWPVRGGWNGVHTPYCFFGLVPVVYLLLTTLQPVCEHRSLVRQIARGCAAGILGSLWFWVSWEAWYFSPLHGAIWGVCVGVGAWASSRPREIIGGVA